MVLAPGFFLLNFTNRIPFHEKMIFLQERKKERGNQTCAPNTLALLNKRIENPHALLKIGAKSGFCAPGARSSQPLHTGTKTLLWWPMGILLNWFESQVAVEKATLFKQDIQDYFWEKWYLGFLCSNINSFTCTSTYNFLFCFCTGKRQQYLVLWQLQERCWRHNKRNAGGVYGRENPEKVQGIAEEGGQKWEWCD